MAEIIVRRLSFGTVYKFFAVGLACSIVPIFLLNAVGFEIINFNSSWNGEPLEGTKWLFIAPAAGLAVSAVLALIIGGLAWIGLLIYSVLHPFRLEYTPVAPSPATAVSTPTPTIVSRNR